MSRFGGFLGASTIPGPATVNSSAPGVYSLTAANHLRAINRWPHTPKADSYNVLTSFYVDVRDGVLTDLSPNNGGTGAGNYELFETEGPDGNNIVAPYFGIYSPAGYYNLASSVHPELATLGSQDFTLECWFKLTETQNPQNRFFLFRFSNSHNFFIDSSFRIAAFTTSTNVYPFGTAAALPADERIGFWHHISFNRSGGSIYCLIDGVKFGSTASDATNYTLSYIQLSYNSASYYFPGFITGARLTVGAARYAADTTYPLPYLPYATEQQTVVPFAPTLTDSFYGDQSVALSWTNGFNGGAALTAYELDYSSDSGSTWTTVNIADPSLTSYTVTGLTNDTSYDFRLRAVNAVGVGANSNVVSATPSSSLPIALVGADAPTTYYGFNTRQDNYYVSTSLASQIFDNSLDNTNDKQWKTNSVTTASFAVDFGQQEELLRYRMWRNTGNEGTPTRWYLQGSNTESDYTSITNANGVLSLNTGNWTTIDTRENINLPTVSTAVPADEPYGEFSVSSPGNYRYYRLYVDGVRADGPGTTTNRIHLAEMQFLALAPAAPSVPTNLAAYAADGGANVNWSATGLVDDFIVEWSDDATFVTTLGTTTATSLGASITGLVNGNTYYARVKSNYSGIHSAYTSAVSFVPAAGYTPIEDNIFRFHLSDATDGINVNAVTTTGYAKLEATDGTTTTTSSVASTNNPNWGTGYWNAGGNISLTSLATGVEKVVKLISCDASGTPSGELLHIDFGLSANSGRVVTLADASGCLSLDSLRINSVTSGIWGGYLSAGLTVLRAKDVPFVNGYYFYYSSNSVNSSGTLNVAGQLLSAAALNDMYSDLANSSGNIVVRGNPGISSDNPSIATDKGYTVYGS